MEIKLVCFRQIYLKIGAQSVRYFKKMVMDVPQESRDEDAFLLRVMPECFWKGNLELEDFLPEVKSQIRKESEQTKVKVSVSLEYLITLTTRIERLEKQVCFFRT